MGGGGILELTTDVDQNAIGLTIFSLSGEVLSNGSHTFGTLANINNFTDVFHNSYSSIFATTNSSDVLTINAVVGEDFDSSPNIVNGPGKVVFNGDVESGLLVNSVSTAGAAGVLGGGTVNSGGTLVITGLSNFAVTST